MGEGVTKIIIAVDDTHLLVKPDQVEHIKDILQEEVSRIIAPDQT